MSEDRKENEDDYCLTPASRLLLRDEPFSMAPLARVKLAPILIDPWLELLISALPGEWFRNDCSSSFVTKYGATFWEYIGIEERFNRMFNEAMASDARFVASVLTRECKQVFEGLKSMVDVGGGTGLVYVSKGIADVFPDMNCIVLDLPRVVGGLEGDKNLTGMDPLHLGGKSLASQGVKKKTVVLHDWTDEESVKLLAKCKEAIISSKNNGGKLIIVEMIVDDKKEEDEATETKLFFFCWLHSL
ncbi:hypothetical protein DH2020_022969 [Rehmannia glutinosa]|uniref:O-methyltransferase C-terminal domain-containing protein n=1 Tax=Rehmannia glutinosa TaxID=99300 RepID=A0ABR0W7L4_REHGL